MRIGQRQFSREFKLKAIRLVKERGGSVAQASLDLDIGENVLRRWIKGAGADPGQAFPGQGQLKPEQLEIDRLRREVAKLMAKRDILKKAAVGSTGQRSGLSECSNRRLVAKGFPWSRVQFERDRIKIIRVHPVSATLGVTRLRQPDLPALTSSTARGLRGREQVGLRCGAGHRRAKVSVRR